MTDKKPNDGLRKLQQAEDAKKAMAEYRAQTAAVDANTERLRALRLAKEAADGRGRSGKDGQEEGRQEGGQSEGRPNPCRNG